MLAGSLYAAVLLLALPLIPLGLPGVWLQVGASAVLVLASGGSMLGWGWVLAFTLLGLVAELIEFASGQWGARRFGGSRTAAWGALFGGLAGAVLGGIPIPIAGPVLASFVGTFAGAILGEMHAQRTVRPGVRVGVGAVIGRAIGVAAKTAVGVTVAVLGIGVVLVERLGG